MPAVTGTTSAPSSFIRDDVRRLATGVLLPHVHDARQAEERAGGRGRDPVHAGAGLGDDALLAEPLREQRLPERVVDLVRAGVREVLSLQPDAVPELLGQTRRARVIGVGRPTKSLGQRRELLAEAGVHPERRPGVGELVERRDQHLGHVASAVLAEPPAGVGEVGRRSSRALLPSRAASSRARRGIVRTHQRLTHQDGRRPGLDGRVHVRSGATRRSRARRSGPPARGRSARARRSMSTSRVSRSRAFTPITLASLATARPSSSSEWVSTRRPCRGLAPSRGARAARRR